MANQITVFLDAAQLPARTQDQQIFDNLWAGVLANLPTFGAQFNAGVAAFNAAAAGSAYAIPYTIDLSGTSDIDPGNGKLRFDNVTQNAAATLRLDLLNNAGTNCTAMIDTFDASTSTVKGSIRIVKQGDGTKFLVFNVTARTAPTGYRDVSVTPVASTSANPFVNGDAVLLFFQRNGDKGDQGAPFVYPTLRVREEQASGTAAGTPVAGSQTRVLNATKKNSISGASLASNQVTLPAGTYKVRGSAPAYAVNSHQAYLYSVTDAAMLVNGTSENTNATSDVTVTRSLLEGEFVLPATKIIELRHYVQTAAGSAALGRAAGSGQGEVHSELLFEKVA
jgi:hypothetical protein